MKDTIIFMSAYRTTKWNESKLHLYFKKRARLDTLLDKYHLTYMLMKDKLVSSKGVLKLDAQYDYVHQSTSFSFTPADENRNVDDFKEIIDRTGLCIKLLHAQAIFADPLYFSIDYIICMESFLTYFGEHIYQIDPIVFSMNHTLIIAFEVIDFTTGSPLKADDIFGKRGNYNLIIPNGYQYFGEENIIPTDNKIAEIINDNIRNFFFELTRERFAPESYSFIHNTLILSNNIDNVESYFCDLISVRELPSPLKNIDTTKMYEYYPQDGASVITNYDCDSMDMALYNGIMLEAIKMYVYLFQIVNAEITSDINDVIRNDLYLENLFFAPHVPIETHNLLSYIHSTSSFDHHQKATKLKISYMTAENESKKNKNGLLLNILLYIISLIGAIDTLDTLDRRLNISFNCSFVIVVFAFSIFGLIWGITEWRRNKQF